MSSAITTIWTNRAEGEAENKANRCKSDETIKGIQTPLLMSPLMTANRNCKRCPVGRNGAHPNVTDTPKKKRRGESDRGFFPPPPRLCRGHGPRVRSRQKATATKSFFLPPGPDTGYKS